MSNKIRQKQFLAGLLTQGANGEFRTRKGIGAKNGSTVSAREEGNDILHRTTLTLANTPVPIVSVTTGAGIGGVKLYDFPTGAIKIIAATALLDLAIAAAKQAGFETEVAGDLGLGSVIITDPTAFSTDPTDDDIAAGIAFLMATGTFLDEDLALDANAGDVNFASGLDLNLNVFADAADIDDDVTTEILASGLVTVHWMKLIA